MKKKKKTNYKYIRVFFTIFSIVKGRKVTLDVRTLVSIPTIYDCKTLGIEEPYFVRHCVKWYYNQLTFLT